MKANMCVCVRVQYHITYNLNLQLCTYLNHDGVLPNFNQQLSEFLCHDLVTADLSSSRNIWRHWFTKIRQSRCLPLEIVASCKSNVQHSGCSSQSHKFIAPTRRAMFCIQWSTSRTCLCSGLSHKLNSLVLTIFMIKHLWQFQNHSWHMNTHNSMIL